MPYFPNQLEETVAHIHIREYYGAHFYMPIVRGNGQFRIGYVCTDSDHYPTRNNLQHLSSMPQVFDISGETAHFLARPVGFKLQWREPGGSKKLRIIRAIPPEGYYALSDIVVNDDKVNMNNPDPSFRCVHESCVQLSDYGKRIWESNESCWNIIDTGFFFHSNNGRAPRDMCPVRLVPYGKISRAVPDSNPHPIHNKNEQFDFFMHHVKSFDKPKADLLRHKIFCIIENADIPTYRIFYSFWKRRYHITREGWSCFTERELYNAQQFYARFAILYTCFFMTTLSTSAHWDRTVQNCDWAQLNKIWNANPRERPEIREIGNQLFLDLIRGPEFLGSFFTNKKEYAKLISEKACEPEFLEMFLIECDEMGSLLPARIFLLVLFALDRQETQPYLNKVINLWRQNERWGDLEDWNCVPWLSYVGPLFMQNAKAYNELKGQIVKVLNNSEASVKIQQWLDSKDGPKKYGYRSGHYPANIAGSECVIL